MPCRFSTTRMRLYNNIYSFISNRQVVELPVKDKSSTTSVRFAEKLGYEFDHEYISYEVDSTRRVH